MPIRVQKTSAIEDKAKQRFMTDLGKICFLNYLPRIAHLPPQHRAKDHLYVFDKRIIPIIIAIQPHLVGIDDRIVILYRYLLRVASVAFLLPLGDVFSNHHVCETAFQGGKAGDGRSQLQRIAVIARQLAGIQEYWQNGLMVYAGHQALIKY